MGIVLGGAKQDKAPVGHAAASPHCHKENAWREHHRRVHLAVALDGPCDSLAIPPTTPPPPPPPPQKKKCEPRFMGVSISKCQL